MFFPVDATESVELDPCRSAYQEAENSNFGYQQTARFHSDQAIYLNKPTIIMCNPNAMIYQWMVNRSNSYWLDFFLGRDCNVLIWNYRGYGLSEQSIFTPNLTPE